VSPATLPVGGCHRQCSKLGLRLLGEVVRPGMEVVWGGETVGALLEPRVADGR
jgi:hypothetical protein